MLLYQGEPELSYSSFDDIVAALAAASEAGVIVVGVDGRSGGGKTTLAKRLTEALDGSLISTDDFAWWHSLFDWPELIIENGILPLKNGNAIDYRPPAWIEREREGSILAKPARVIVVEGVGSTQERMRSVLDFKIWVQTDAEVAKERGLLRDLAERPDPEEALRFWNEWQEAEDVFQTAQKSWLVADFGISGQS